MNHDEREARYQALLAKRDQLHAEQAQRMAQQRQAESQAHFQRHLGEPLTRAGVQYDVLWHRDQCPGPLAHYPIGFASVRWDRVPQAVELAGGTDAILKAQFQAALLALEIAPSTRVIADWGVAGMPRVALSAADACAQALTLMRQGSDLWVYADQGAWLVEIYHEGYVTYAPAPGRPEDAGDGWRRSV